jgi:L-alanine-DL-glutamate epimerase-like enolase superfamily enzyme
MEPVPIRDKWPLLVALIEVVDGNITVPEAPGLVVEFDESVIKRLQT